MTRGGECMQNGELGLGLGFFKKALALNPTGEKTKVMVERLESKASPPNTRTAPWTSRHVRLEESFGTRVISIDVAITA